MVSSAPAFAPNQLKLAALQYASAGCPVFPLAPNSKIPYKGSKGFKDATTDLGIIKQWWSETAGGT